MCHNRTVSASRSWHRLAIHLALVAHVLASAHVAVGPHEHDLWRGDSPESVYCVVDHRQLDGAARLAAAEQPISPELQAADRGHRHVCVGLHGAAPPPAVHRDLTRQPLHVASRSFAIASAGPAHQGVDLALPGPRGPPAA
jgi:hypothetical protein